MKLLRPRRHRRSSDEGGFVLLESVIAIALITVIMTALTALFVTSMRVTNHQRATQNAIRIATDVIDQARGLGAQNLPADWPSQTINGVTYSVTLVSAPCSLDGDGTCTADETGSYLRADLTVSWTGQECAATGCQYRTSVVLSALPDPIFLTAAASITSTHPPSGDSALADPTDHGAVVIYSAVARWDRSCPEATCAGTGIAAPGATALPAVTLVVAS